MIKEIALRKLASDEGINPYGVGALGAVGLTTVGYTPLYDHIPIIKNLSKKIDKSDNLARQIGNKIISHKNSILWDEPKLAEAKIKLQESEQWLKRLREGGDIFNWIPDAEDRLKKNRRTVADLTDSINKRKNMISFLTNRHERVKGMNNTLRQKYIKTLKPIGIGTRIVAPLAALGLGGKYLYDKLTD